MFASLTSRRLLNRLKSRGSFFMALEKLHACAKKKLDIFSLMSFHHSQSQSILSQPTLATLVGKRSGASFKGSFKVARLTRFWYYVPARPSFLSHRNASRGLCSRSPRRRFSSPRSTRGSPSSDVIDSWYLYRIDSADKLEDTARRIADLHEVWSRARCD